MAAEVSRHRSRLLPTIQEDAASADSLVGSARGSALVGSARGSAAGRPDRGPRPQLTRTPPVSRLPRLVRDAPGSGGRGGRLQSPALEAGPQGTPEPESVALPPVAAAPQAGDRDRPRQRDRDRNAIAEEAVRLGPKGDYFLGTDNIRRLLQTFDQEVYRFKLQFASGKPDTGSGHSGEATPEKQAESDALLSARLQKAFTAIAHAVDVVRTKTGDNLEPINSEQQLLALITALKNLGEAGTSEELVGFWEDLKYAVERVQSMCDRFNQQILAKLRTSCLSFSGTLDTHTPLSDRYSAEVARYLEQVETLWKNTRILCASCGNGIKQRLLDVETQATRQMARAFDVRRFAVVELVVDLLEKLSQMSRIAHTWVDRDETFVLQLGREIRDLKRDTQEKRRALEKDREQQEELLRSLKTARLICENSRRHLLAIEDEIRMLQRDQSQGKNELQYKTSQLQLKQQAVEFLDTGIAQTKHNFAMRVRSTHFATHFTTLRLTSTSLHFLEHTFSILYGTCVVVSPSTAHQLHSVSNMYTGEEAAADEADRGAREQPGHARDRARQDRDAHQREGARRDRVEDEDRRGPALLPRAQARVREAHRQHPAPTEGHEPGARAVPCHAAPVSVLWTDALNRG